MSDTYREELARAAMGEDVNPRRLAWLKRQEAKEAAHDDAVAQARRDIEKAREKYLADGEAREAKARPGVDSALADLAEARTAHAAAVEALRQAQAEMKRTAQVRASKHGVLWKLANDVWGRSGPPRDENGNPVVGLCVHGRGVVVDDLVIYADRDTPLPWAD